MKPTFLILMACALGAAPLCKADAATTKPTAPFQVTVSGHGRPVLLIPGLSSSGAVWDGAVKHLAEHFECHVFTLAGFAGEPRIGEPFLETERTAMADYIRERKLDHPVVIGHSLGGFLALWLAETNPDLVGPLVIVDALPFLPAVYNPAATVDNTRAMAEQMKAGMSSSDAAFERNSAAAVKTMVTGDKNYDLVMSWVKETDRVAAADAMYEMFTTDLRPETEKIRTPVLVLGTWIAYRENEADTATRAAVEKNFEAQYSRVKGATIKLADHARHFIMLDDPDWFYGQLDGFLAANR